MYNSGNSNPTITNTAWCGNTKLVVGGSNCVLAGSGIVGSYTNGGGNSGCRPHLLVPPSCPQQGTACCVRQDSCTSYGSPGSSEPQQCADEGGFWLLVGLCPQGCNDAAGACCLPDGSCVIAISPWCDLAGGSYMGAGTACEDFDCALGACCLPAGNCEVRPVVPCEADGGIWRGQGTVCGDFNQNGADDACESIGSCRSDTNEDDVVDIIDFLTLLEDWGPCK